MRLLVIIALSAILFSCSHNQVKESPVADPKPTPVVASSGTFHCDLSNVCQIDPQKRPSIVYDPIISWDEEKSFIKEGEKQANAVLNSQCFEDEILAAKFEENLGLNNLQIWKKFVDASPMKVGIKMFTGGIYEKINHTVAYEGNPIKMNRKFVWSATYVGSTSLHEGFGHGLDFRHDYNINYNTSRTIPYTLNRIFEKCAKKLGYKIEY